MTNIDIKVTNPNGLTPRLAAELVEEANNYSCDIHMSDGTHEGCDLKSIMNVFGSIVAGAGDTLHITFDGLDEVQALRGFKALVQTMKF